MLKRINFVFIIYLVFIGLVVTGILPRWLANVAAAGLVVYFLAVPLEEPVLFFARSIPFFVALPLTAGFDSLNLWRILSLVIFLRWLNFEKIKSFFRPPFSTIFYLLLAIFLLALLSLTQAAGYILAVKRLIYFINLSLVAIVVYDLISKHREFSRKLIVNLAIPTVSVALIGLLQLASTYLMNIFQFVDFWGGVVERNLFGNVWADIAIKANTWFAYYGEQISLRLFSIFPDSHSFPIFLIAGLPAVLALSLATAIRPEMSLKSLYKARGRFWVVMVPVIFLAVILSGTRGMWAAGLVTGLLIAGLVYLLRKKKADNYHKNIFKYVASYLIFFFILFGVAYPIFASPQFQLSKDSSKLLANRVRSLINFSETSNARRIEIWKASLTSIKKHPLLGVGIGNFPVVVGEDLARAKAGSSAHNLYLQIAAELGVPALILALYFLWLLLTRCWRNFLLEDSPQLTIYFAASLIFIPWNLLYSLTDVAIFDERAFLIFSISVALLIASGKQNDKH
ncbi:MAG: O-antigen ligase family protein [Patescibacteria group bacterium]